MTEEQFKNMHLQLSAEDIRKVDEWKISHGMKSRTEAIRAMVRIVTGSDADESSILSSFSEKDKLTFVKPENNSNRQNQKNEPVEELIRKMVKEELSKLIGNK